MDQSVLDDFRWLVGDSAAQPLVDAVSAFDHGDHILKISKRLRKATTATRAALVVEQAQLRIRARIKFARANEMFFTRRGLEQSTAWPLAKYKASRFAGLSRVADICCGVGGDLIGFANRPAQAAGTSEKNGSQNKQPDAQVLSTVGVDSDQVTALFAARNLEVNLSAIDATSCTIHRKSWVQQQSFDQLNLDEFDGLHLDPDRRTERRTVKGSRFSPPLDQVYQTVRSNQLLAIKAAPATQLEDYFPGQIYREWIGDRRECKQQLLWSGQGASSIESQFGRRSATVIDGDSFHQFSAAESEVASTVGVVDDVMEYLFEPHATVLAARLTDALAGRFGLSRATREVPYLFADELVDCGLLSAFKVLDVMRLDMKAIIRSLNRFDVGSLELKRRGIDQITAGKFSKFKVKGSSAATLILTRVGKQSRRKAILARRIPSSVMPS